MSTLLDIDHEANDLSEWDNTITSGGGLIAASAASAMASTSYGMALTPSGVSLCYGDAAITHTTNVLRYRFYIDPNSLTMAEGDTFDIVNVVDSSNVEYQLLRLNKSGANYRMMAIAYDDGRGTNKNTGFFNVSDAPMMVEILLKRASSDVAADGEQKVWIDGVSSGTDRTNIDIFDNWDYAKFEAGSISGGDAGTSGTFYMDQFVVTDTELEIGPHVEPAATALSVAGSGFAQNYKASSSADVETILAAQGAGVSIYLESVSITGFEEGTVTIGSGESSGSVATEIVGPIDMTATGKPYKVQFTRPVKLDANTALTIDTGAQVGVQCFVTGYVK